MSFSAFNTIQCHLLAHKLFEMKTRVPIVLWIRGLKKKLQLHVAKTKEMILDFSRNQREYSGIEIKGETVGRVKSYKYLGITFDDKLSWRCHVDAVVKKIHSRLYCLRKLRSFDVREAILQMFYTADVVVCLVFLVGDVRQANRNRSLQQ